MRPTSKYVDECLDIVQLQNAKAVNTTPQMTCFRGAKSVHKMATRKSDDELPQHDNKLRIWTRSEKFRKVEYL